MSSSAITLQTKVIAFVAFRQQSLFCIIDKHNITLPPSLKPSFK